ncbi:hypothetical protein CDL12_27121 [Handroanthus impetiginosus]|uniref:Uncharacterized protein n=1 Tax=Handroanthus impetiginosus TaxID=429701 RepID=A0A2G9G4Y7_9LAMI|nr:hypothetical protein CDL12_27121 [Handroanthus impetiginosus]
MPGSAKNQVFNCSSGNIFCYCFCYIRILQNHIEAIYLLQDREMNRTNSGQILTTSD